MIFAHRFLEWALLYWNRLIASAINDDDYLLYRSQRRNLTLLRCVTGWLQRRKVLHVHLYWKLKNFFPFNNWNNFRSASVDVQFIASYQNFHPRDRFSRHRKSCLRVWILNQSQKLRLSLFLRTYFSMNHFWQIEDPTWLVGQLNEVYEATDWSWCLILAGFSSLVARKASLPSTCCFIDHC